MSRPPIYDILTSDATSGPLLDKKIFSFGQALDQSVEAPYCIWQYVSASPFNMLGCTPEIESALIQVDVYETSRTKAITLFEATRDALESHCFMNAGPRELIDNTTHLFRVSADYRFLLYR